MIYTYYEPITLKTMYNTDLITKNFQQIIVV